MKYTDSYVWLPIGLFCRRSSGWHVHPAGSTSIETASIEASGIIIFSSSTGLCCTTLTNAE